MRPCGSIHHSVSDLRVSSERSIVRSSAGQGLYIDDALDDPLTIFETLDAKRRVGCTFNLDRRFVPNTIHRFAPSGCVQARILDRHHERAEQHPPCGHLVDEGIQPVDEQQVFARRLAGDRNGAFGPTESRSVTTLVSASAICWKAASFVGPVPRIPISAPCAKCSQAFRMATVTSESILDRRSRYGCPAGLPGSGKVGLALLHRSAGSNTSCNSPKSRISRRSSSSRPLWSINGAELHLAHNPVRRIRAFLS